MIEVKEINIDDVIAEDRVRKVQGVVEMDSLERSILSLGLLQPIAVTPDNKLIFGARRLKACKRLGMTTIPARIIDIDADDPVTALCMEKDENEHRLDFTPSERVEIARRIEESLAGRRGSNQHQQKEAPQNFVEAQSRSERESLDIAAKSVDMNRETYRQAKTVVDSGEQGVVEQMDRGELSVHAAYEQVRRRSREGRADASNKPRASNRQLTFKVTLYKNPNDDAKILFAKGGKDYCSKLAMALLKSCGHRVEVD